MTIPVLSNAGENTTNSAPQAPSLNLAADPFTSALTNAFTLTNGMIASVTLEYSFEDCSAITTNSDLTVTVANVQREDPVSDFNKFVLRHMTEDQEYRFVVSDADSSRARKILGSVSAGYGEFFDDPESVTFWGNNGARWDPPGYLYVRSRFTF